MADQVLAFDNPSPTSFPLADAGQGVVVARAASLESALPGTTAVFSTRLGGVSRSPWDQMNVGYQTGDSPVDVTENRRRLFRALDLDVEHLVTAGQVHGDAVGVATASGHQPDTDGLVTLSRSLILAVFCADCVPIWLLDPKTPAAAVVHAGWRGTLAGVAGRAVEVMRRKLGCRPGDLLAAIGPSIGPCCYEVGPEVSEPARARLGPGVLAVPLPGGKARLDLWEANRQSLIRAGLDPLRVDVSGLCTFCRGELFHSYRRETVRSPASPRAGRMVALVKLPERRP